MSTAQSTLLSTFVLVWIALPVGADQNDARLDGLFSTFRQAKNPAHAYQIESQIWRIWLEHENEDAADLLAEGTALMDTDPRKALLIFTDLVTTLPDYAEAWNKRATLYYLIGDFAASKRDIEKTLALEPRHFGALSGLGLVHLSQAQYVEAIAAFEAVLVIHPNSGGTRRQIELIRAYMRRNTI